MIKTSDTMVLSHRIGASWEAGTEVETWDDVTPTDVREVLARYQFASRPQVERAMTAALEAFPSWRAQSALNRAAILARAAALLRERRGALAQSLALENGKTLAEASVEVDKSADFLDFYAATARLPAGGMIADARPGTWTMALNEPIGTIAMITPWNDPMITPARKLGPALIAGCTVVLKPARETPLATFALVRALVDAGLPPGVLNCVLTDHATFGNVVLAHERLAGVTFTGSTVAGLSLSRQLAGRTVRLQSEMGGKNASVVLADADLDLAAASIANAAFSQGGQRCTATSRLIVEDAVHGQLITKLLAVLQTMRVGHSLDAASKIGPLVNVQHQRSVLDGIKRAVAEGGQVLSGGGTPAGEAFEHGCYVSPTVIDSVTSKMALWRDEVFGPVLGVRRVASFEEAVAAVNDSNFGLSSALYTTSLTHAHRFISLAETGQVAINLPTAGWDVHHPFGGFRESGSAFKEQGLEGLRFYTRTKAAAIRFE